MNEKTFEEFEKILDSGYQVYFNYLNNRYLIFKTNDNCYTQKLIKQGSKNPPAVISMITKKYLNEIYSFIDEIEYKYEV